MKAPRTEWVPHLDDYRPTLILNKYVIFSDLKIRTGALKIVTKNIFF